MQHLAGKDEEFKDATPELFGPGFVKHAKDHTD